MRPFFFLKPFRKYPAPFARPTLLREFRQAPFVAMTVLLAMLFGMMPRIAWADDVSPADGSPAAGAGGLGMPDSGGGAAAGDLASADPSTGGLQMGYPFQLPTARGTVQPSLGIQFSSSGGDSDAGFGWSLSVPFIERRGAGGAPDPQYNDPAYAVFPAPSVLGLDHFLYMGAVPLVPICIGVADLPCKVSAVLPGASTAADQVFYGWSIFRAQVEHGPSQAFLWSPNRQTWVVLGQDGAMMELGTSLNGQSDGAERDSLRDGRAGVFRWHLSRVYDPRRTAKGNPTNPIVYLWNNTNPLRGLELQDVYDTPADPDNASTFEGYAHHAHLTYGALPYSKTGNFTRWRATPLRRLTDVDVTSQDITGSQNGARAMVRRYHLRYDDGDLALAMHPHHSHLKTITLEGRCANSSATVTAPGNVLEGAGALLPSSNCPPAPPTTFTYSNALVAPTKITPIAGLTSLRNGTAVSPVGGTCTKQQNGTAGGLACLGCPLTTIPEPTCAGNDNALICTCAAGPTTPVNELRAGALVDFNNDGLVDLLVPQVNGRKVQDLCLNTGHDVFTCGSDVSALSAAIQAPGPTGENAAYMGDFTADGQLNWLTMADAPGESAAGDTHALQGFASFSPVGPVGGKSYALNPGIQDSWDFVPKPNKDSIFRILETPETVVDVNGDGLLDLFVKRSTPLRDRQQTLPPGYTGFGVAITTRTAAGQIFPFGHAIQPQRIPVDHSDLSGWHGFSPQTPYTAYPIWRQLSQAWSKRAVARKDANKTTPKTSAYEFADMDGDGLVDVVAITAAPLGGTSGYAVRYWPGFGDGTFGNNVQCTRTPGVGSAPAHVDCYVTSGSDGSITLSGGIPSTFDPDETKATFHDLNGDGLADLVVATPQAVDVFTNADGTKLATPGAPSLHLAASDLGDTWATPDAKLEFADIDGSGTDDLVFADKTMGYVDPIVNGAKPGLLERIDNGVGGVTVVTYDTIARLDKAATQPWKRHSAQSTHVVTSITTTNGLTGGQKIARTTRYDYRDPVYEPHSRTFRGFEYVETTRDADAISPGTTTATTFLIGQCPHAQASPCPLSYDNPWDALRGLPVLTVTRTATRGLFVGTTQVTQHTRYQVRQVATSAKDDLRIVRLVYPDQTDSYIEDTTPQTPGSGGSEQVADVTVGTASDNPLAGTPRTLVYGPGSAHLRQFVTRDAWGRATGNFDYGRVGASGSAIDPTIVTQTTYATPPGAFVLNKVRTSNTGKGDSFGNFTDAGRTRTFDYDAAGGLTDVTATLSGTLPLSRAGNVAVPAEASAVAAHSVKLLHVDLDPVYGFASQKTRPNGAVETFTFEPRWHQFATARTTRTGTTATGYGSLLTTASFDIGLGRIIGRWEASGAASSTVFDGLDRPIAISVPGALTPTMPTSMTSLAYPPAIGGVRRVHVTTRVGINETRQAWTYLDGLGTTLATVSQADPSTDGAAWSVGALTDFSALGLPAKRYAAMFWNGDPATGAMPTATAGLASVGYLYDALGRVVQVTGLNTGVIAKMVYHPLVTETWDAEDLLPGGLHVNTPTLVAYDGHHRPLATVETSVKPTPSSVTTNFEYLPTGELTKLTRTFDKGPSAGGGRGTYVRTMAYDTLGRLVQNLEPNTSVTLEGGRVRGWNYAYDDAGDMVATSDARGCGMNSFFDAAGRKLADDYVPCTSTQVAYSAPDLVTGTGTEGFYRYDTGEPGQAPDVTASMWKGRLVSVSDRASHTRYGYDGRGNTVRTSRQLAKPDAGAEPLATRYAPHWFERTRAYDYGDRLQTESTGADVDELRVGGKSTVTTSYGKRGLVSQVTSDYGPLLTGFKYDEDGSLKTEVLGDALQTTSTFSYANAATKRLTQATIARGIASPAMTLSDVSMTYDAVGNPLTTKESPSAFAAWAAGAKPVSRTIGYDDRYRVASVAYDSQGDTQVDPMPSVAAPMTASNKRVTSQTFEYDGLGNTTKTTDDTNTFFDRSLGVISHDPNAPNRIQGAGSASTTGGTVQTTFDAAGNLLGFGVSRTKACFKGNACGYVGYTYDWDEVGNLAAASRSDNGGSPETLAYAYDAAGMRVLTSRVASRGFVLDLKYQAEIFSSLRLNGAHFDGTDYQRDATTEVVYLMAAGTSLARLVYATNDKTASASGTLHVLFEVGDMLGSTSFVIDKATSDIVEKRTYQAFGAIDSEYKSDKWKDFREEYGFTGKELDLEVGITYFGARYYSAELGRFLSADPLAVHAAGADLNPYAYVGGHVASHVDPMGLADEEDPTKDTEPGGAVGPPIEVTVHPPGWQPPTDCAEDGEVRACSTVTEVPGTGAGETPPPPSQPQEGFWGTGARDVMNFLGEHKTAVAVGLIALTVVAVVATGGAGAAFVAAANLAGSGAGMMAAAMNTMAAVSSLGGAAALGIDAAAVAASATAAVAAVAPTAVATAAAATAVGAVAVLAKASGSYTNSHASGKTYSGKGSRARSQQSGRRVERATGDQHVATEWSEATNSTEAFKDEATRIEANGGVKSDGNYNRIESPGKKLLGVQR